ncbi:MAG: divergent polysaccharide deacetylase [Xanthobacteraceae bacterium]|nr:divergent polysaccharide deacetylase [Xanthobacteraceae bacterium]
MSDDLNAPPLPDDLDAPLGQASAKKKKFLRLPITGQQAGLVGLVLFITAFSGWALFGDNPFGGEPMVVVAVAPTAEDGPPPIKPDAAKKTPAAAAPSNGVDPVAGPRHSEGPAGGSPGATPPPGSKTVTIIDGSSGKRQEVVIPGNAPTEGQAPAAALDERLSESTRHGLIPKLAPDGTRPADAYGRAVVALPGKPDAPRIALVVTGLGVSTAGTSDAFAKLPGAVTFAFSPYTTDLERLAARARSEGHELLLQVPMEPFDYPDNDPGPQTLLTSLTADQNLDRLHWLLSRFQGYVGVVNFMGERFTGTEASFAPILRETAKRGLIYFDDSSSARSLASQLTSTNSLPFVKAGVVVDAVPAPGEIDRALSRLEAAARERGVAVGTAGSLPVTIERLSKWAKGAAQRGILLVPLSAVVGKAKSS